MNAKPLQDVIKKQTNKSPVAQKGIITTLKFRPCARERVEANTQLKWGKHKETHGAQICHLKLLEKMVKKVQVDLLYCLGKELTEVPRIMLMLSAKIIT